MINVVSVRQIPGHGTHEDIPTPSSDQTLLSGLRTIDDIILIEHGKNICRHKLLDLYNLSVVATRGGPVTAQPNSSCGTGLGLGS